MGEMKAREAAQPSRRITWSMRTIFLAQAKIRTRAWFATSGMQKSG